MLPYREVTISRTTSQVRPLLVSRQESARALGISLRMLDYLVTRGEIEVRKVGRRTLIPRRAIEQFARAKRRVHLTAEAESHE
jgi:excisionase family DNA binding protein